jgi:hypothetical protein
LALVGHYVVGICLIHFYAIVCAANHLAFDYFWIGSTHYVST